MPPLPICQFYHISIDNSVPYRVMGTMQDQGTASGPSNSLSSAGISLSDWHTVGGGRWYKYSAYTSAAERALVADCRAYVLEASGATGPGAFIGQVNILSIGAAGGTFWAASTGISPGESSYDVYRHGKYPPMVSANQYSPNGGQIGYNVMFADGHVSKLLTREEGFKAARMRFPG